MENRADAFKMHLEGIKLITDEEAEQLKEENKRRREELLKNRQKRLDNQ